MKQKTTVEDTLLIAAKVVEDGGIKHPLDAVSIAASSKNEYYRACKRLHDVCGLDLMDLTTDEMIDWLTGAAIMDWNA